MELHRKIGLVFIISTFLVLVWNALTPSNEDHVLNMAEMAGASVLFTLAFFAPAKLSQAIQVICLGIAAFLPMTLPNSPYWGMVIAVIALDLLYAYGGYKTRPVWKLFATSAVLYCLCAIALSRLQPITVEMYARAFVWTGMLGVFCWLQWLVVCHREKVFFAEFAASLITQNRDLLEQNKQLVQECNDADAD